MKICNLKIDVSREASIHFLHISQNATPTMQFAPCRHLTQPWQSDLAKNTQHDTSKVLCLPREKWRWACRQSAAPATKTGTHLLKTSQKYCACHTKRLVDTLWEHVWNVTEVPRLPRKMRLCETSGNLQKVTTCCRTRHWHGHTGLTRTVANGCERLRTVADGCDRERNVWRTQPQPPEPQSETGTLATHSGKKIEICWSLSAKFRCNERPRCICSSTIRIGWELIAIDPSPNQHKLKFEMVPRASLPDLSGCDVRSRMK